MSTSRSERHYLSHCLEKGRRPHIYAQSLIDSEAKKSQDLVTKIKELINNNLFIISYSKHGADADDYATLLDELKDLIKELDNE